METQSFMLKIDLAKTFDRLEWSFIAAALARKGLHGHFIKLVHACVSSPRFSFIINVQAFESFLSSRGIRQGCPLSPYLFILAINELSISLGEALEANQLTGISLGPNCPPIHSLLFADDLIICGQASLLEAQSMKQVLMLFCHSSGQLPNWTKSGLLFSRWVDDHTKHDIQSVFPIPLIDESFIHLGHLLVLPAKNRSEAYDFVLQKFRNKLTTYKANLLSHAARVELINLVFASILVYYMSNILFSKKCIAKINDIIMAL
jgi:mannosylglycoprotein endo-beta-mannosidase